MLWMEGALRAFNDVTGVNLGLLGSERTRMDFVAAIRAAHHRAQERRWLASWTDLRWVNWA